MLQVTGQKAEECCCHPKPASNASCLSPT